MEIMLKNKCCLYVIISIRFFSITICYLLIEFPSYYSIFSTECIAILLQCLPNSPSLPKRQQLMVLSAKCSENIHFRHEQRYKPVVRRPVMLWSGRKDGDCEQNVDCKNLYQSIWNVTVRSIYEHAIQHKSFINIFKYNYQYILILYYYYNTIV